MILTIQIKDSAVDKIMYFLEHLKDDVTIVSKDYELSSDIEPINENDLDYKYILQGRKERKENPENYVSEDTIN